MEEVTKFVYESIFSNKKALRQMANFESRVAKHQRKLVQGSATTDTAITSSRAKSTKSRLVIAEAAALKEKKRLAKELVNAKKFEDFKSKAITSAAFDRLNAAQRMQIQRVLNEKKANNEIVDDYRRAMREIAQINRKKAAKDKAKQKLDRSRAKRKSGGSGGIGGMIGAGAMGGPVAAVAMAVVTAGIGGVMAVNSGVERIVELQRSAMLAGMELTKFQRESFAMAKVSGISQEQVGDIFKDVQERFGEVLRGGTKFDEKTGTFRGGEAEGMMNQLLKKGLVTKDNYKSIIKSSDASELVELMNKATAGMDQATIISLTEDFANDASKVILSMQKNSKGIQSARQSFDNLGVGITKEDVDNAREFASVLHAGSLAAESFTTKFTSSFMKSLSPSTREMLSKTGDLIVKLADLLGRVFGNVLTLISPVIAVLGAYFDKFLDAMIMMQKGVTFVLAGIEKTVVDFLDTLHDYSGGLIGIEKEENKPTATVKPKVEEEERSWFSKWFDEDKPTTAKSSYNDNSSSNSVLNQSSYYSSYNMTPTPVQANELDKAAGLSMPPVDVSSMEKSNSNTNATNTTNTTVQETTVVFELDGEVVAERVVRSDSFDNGVMNSVSPLFNGN